MKKIYPIKPCPWCKMTPKFVMWFDKPTFLPHFKCETTSCTVQPESRYVPIRNTSKKDPERFRSKIELMILHWNRENPIPAYEGLEFDFDDICNNQVK